MIPVHLALLRLLVSIVFGALIGIEREWRHKSAGIKTNTLVTIGSATFAMMSNTFGPTNHNPAQIAAAVVTGIGFVGAGVIIHRGVNVQGVTTAATLWANAAMGVAIGLGEVYLASAMCVAILTVQFTMRYLGVLITRMKKPDEASRIELYIECDCTAIARVNELWNEHASRISLVTLRRVITQKDLVCGWRNVFMAPGEEPIDLSTLEEQLASVGGVHRIESRFLGFEEAPGSVM